MTHDPVNSIAGRSADLALLVDQLSDRLEAGEPVDFDAIVKDHPEHADELRELMPAVAVMVGFSRSGSNGLPAPDSQVGELGDFRIIGEVGRGGMGVVYEALQISLNRPVALKVLPFAATMDPRQLQRFRHEAQAAALLHHPNIVPVHGVGCERGVHYYAMQLIEGRSLGAVIEEMRPASRGRQRPEEGTVSYPPVVDAPGSPDRDTAPVAALTTQKTRRDKAHYRRLAELIAQAADALEYAHSMGVVHRDIKPGNLMLDDGGNLWVTDFGLAKLETAIELTMSGDLLGTLRYMSPEQALARHGLVDHRTDVYSLGATLYELLTLRPAVRGESKADILRHLAFEEPVALRKLDRAIPTELETITLKCLAKEPAERYASAGELAKDLRRFLDDQPIQAKPPSARQRAAKWVRRHKSLVRLAVAILMAAAAALGAGTYALWQKEREVRTAYGRAQANLRAARDAADQMLTQVADRLKNVPRMEPVRRELLRQALRIYGGFLHDYGTDPAVRREAAGVSRQMGSIYFELGQAPEAERAYGEAIALLRSPINDAPDDIERLRLWGRCQDGLGQCLSVATKTPQAEQAIREAVRLRELLSSIGSREPGDRLDLAVSLSNLGRVVQEAGRAADAEGLLRRAVAIHGQLPADFSRRPDALDALATAETNLGLFLFNTGRPKEAEAACRRALRLRERLAAESTDVVDYQVRMAECRLRLGMAISGHDRMEEKEALLRNVLDHLLRIENDFPFLRNITVYVRAAAQSLVGLSEQDGRIEEATAIQRRVVDHKRKLLDAMPGEYAIHINDFGYHSFCLGQLLSGAGHEGEAEIAHRGALQFRLKCQAEDPDFVDATRAYVNRNAIADSYYALGKTLWKLGKIAEAEDSFVRASTIWDELARGGPTVRGFYEHYLISVAAALSDLASVRRQLGRSDEADQSLQQAISWHQLAIARSPGNPLCYFNYAFALRMQGRFDEALAEYRHGIRLGRPGQVTLSDRWIIETKQLIALDGKLPEILAGVAEPAGAGERLGLAGLCFDYKRRYAAAARLFSAAFTAEPKLADDPAAGHRYNAACAAALAGCGKGTDAAKLDDAERSRLRRQSLDWLTADLAARAKRTEIPAERLKLRQSMQRWQQDADLAGVRDAAALAKLPDAERAAWQELWADVADRLKHTPGPETGIGPAPP